MKIAITGTDGFVGSYLVKYFSKKGFEVLVLNREKWDLREKYSQDLVCDIFIHCASDTGYTKSKKEMIRNNVEINKNVLNVINNSNCKHFIYISSSSVYQGLSGIISADVVIDKNNLKNSYSLTKYLAEEYITKNIAKHVKLSIIRPRAIYGKGDKVLIPEILKNQIFGRLILPGNGRAKTSISEINKFVIFIGSIVLENADLHSLQSKQIYNFSSEIKTYNELFLEIIHKYNLRGVIHIPIFIFKILCIFNKSKYSYIIDTFEKDKILKTD